MPTNKKAWTPSPEPKTTTEPQLQQTLETGETENGDLLCLLDNNAQLNQRGPRLQDAGDAVRRAPGTQPQLHAGPLKRCNSKGTRGTAPSGGPSAPKSAAGDSYQATSETVGTEGDGLNYGAAIAKDLLRLLSFSEVLDLGFWMPHASLCTLVLWGSE